MKTGVRGAYIGKRKNKGLSKKRISNGPFVALTKATEWKFDHGRSLSLYDESFRIYGHLYGTHNELSALSWWERNDSNIP